MKTRQRLIVTLLMAMFMGMQVMAQQAYAFLSTDGKTLTFYYDTKKNTRQGGTAYALNTGYSSPEWCYNKDITKVVFNSSFKNARPTSTHSWFEFQTNLVTITGISNLNTSEVTSMRYMFCGCISLTSIVLSGFDTSNVTDMSYMFAECFSLESLDVSKFNTSKVTDMSCMFRNCSSLTNLDVSALNTSNVTNMEEMFAFCEGLTSLDVSSLNTSRVTNMAWMFGGCNYLENINLKGFNTSRVTNMYGMFNQCNMLTSLDLTSFNTSKVRDMSEMFWLDTNLTTIYVGDGWNTNNLTASQTEWGSENGWANMFYNCKNLKGENGTTYDENHIGVEYAHIDGVGGKGYLSSPPEAYVVFTKSTGTLTFYYDGKKSSRTGSKYDTYEMNEVGCLPEWYIDHSKDIKKVVFNSSFKDARPTCTSYWFAAGVDDDWNSTSQLTTITNMKYLNTSQVTDMNHMFENCDKLTTIDVSGFNTAKVTNMEAMFRQCNALKTLNVSGFNTKNVKNMSDMFSSCYVLEELNVSNWNTSRVTNMSYLFAYSGSITMLDVSKWNTARVTDISYIFAGCSSLRALDLSNWNTAKVTNMCGVFDECYNLESLDISNWNTAKVSDMSYMFIQCQVLTSLDLSSFNTSLVSNMDYMFSWSSSLETIWVGDSWDTSNVTSGVGMFNNCNSITGEKGTKYKASRTGVKYARIDGGSSTPGYFSSKPAGITTSVNPIENGELKIENSSEEWYTIDGRKLSGKPTKKGVYIRNGKAVVN